MDADSGRRSEDGGRDWPYADRMGVSAPPRLVRLRGDGRVCLQDLSCVIHWSTYPLPRPNVCQLMVLDQEEVEACADEEGAEGVVDTHPSWKRYTMAWAFATSSKLEGAVRRRISPEPDGAEGGAAATTATGAEDADEDMGPETLLERLRPSRYSCCDGWVEILREKTGCNGVLSGWSAVVAPSDRCIGESKALRMPSMPRCSSMGRNDDCCSCCGEAIPLALAADAVAEHGVDTLKNPACMADPRKSSCCPRNWGAKANRGPGPDVELGAAFVTAAPGPDEVAGPEALVGTAAVQHACSSPRSRTMASTACSTLEHTR